MRRHTWPRQNAAQLLQCSSRGAAALPLDTAAAVASPSLLDAALMHACADAENKRFQRAAALSAANSGTSAIPLKDGAAQGTGNRSSSEAASEQSSHIKAHQPDSAAAPV